MKINKLTNIKYNTFKKAPTIRDNESQNAILMLRDPNASIKFQQSQISAQNADSVATNPFKALGYKLYRTFNMICNNENVQSNVANKFDRVA